MRKINIKKFSAGVAVTMFGITLFMPTALANYTAVSISGNNLTAGGSNALTITWTSNVTNWSGYILKVTMPAGFDVSQVSNTATCPLYVSASVSTDNVNGVDILLISRTGGGDAIAQNTEISCTVSGIINPNTPGETTPNFSVGGGNMYNVGQNSFMMRWDNEYSVTGLTLDAAQNVPEFSTYMFILTALVAGWMVKSMFKPQGQEA